jgi:hypothetical protein
MNYDEWTKKACLNIMKLNKGQEFELKSLFEGFEWESLKKGERIVFGKYFANEVRESRVNNVISIEKARNNHSKYLKVY